MILLLLLYSNVAIGVHIARAHSWPMRCCTKGFVEWIYWAMNGVDDKPVMKISLNKCIIAPMNNCRNGFGFVLFKIKQKYKNKCHANEYNFRVLRLTHFSSVLQLHWNSFHFLHFAAPFQNDKFQKWNSNQNHINNDNKNSFPSFIFRKIDNCIGFFLLLMRMN